VSLILGHGVYSSKTVANLWPMFTPDKRFYFALEKVQYNVTTITVSKMSHCVALYK